MNHVRQQFRLKKPVDDWLKQRAEASHRSKNGELNALLEQIQEAENEKSPVTGK